MMRIRFASATNRRGRRIGTMWCVMRINRSALLIAMTICLPVANGLMAAGPATAPADKAKPADPDAKDLLNRMSKVYAECKSYHDSGTVKVVYLVDGEVDEKSFTTAFVRPDHIRFEYRQEHGGNKGERYVVWESGKDVRAWGDIYPKG